MPLQMARSLGSTSLRRRPAARDDEPVHRIVIALYPGVQPLDAVGPHDAFAGANQALIRSGRAPFYDLALVGETPTVQCESGLRLGADPLGAIAGDTLLIPVDEGRSSR